jgi:Flp pilus assembly protein TadD
MLRGELAYRRGDYAAAWQLLREAVQLDDALAYTHRAAGVEFSQSEL